MYIENVEEKKIQGLSVRTTNEQEMTPSGKISALWQRFDGLVDVDYKNGSRVYGVYSDYESDATGSFTVLAGTDQTDVRATDPLEMVTIQSGQYLVFHATGQIPQVVIDTWDQVWEYFAQETSDYKRVYTTDFEYYLNQNEIKIYIAVEERESIDG